MHHFTYVSPYTSGYLIYLMTIFVVCFTLCVLIIFSFKRADQWPFNSSMNERARDKEPTWSNSPHSHISATSVVCVCDLCFFFICDFILCAGDHATGKVWNTNSNAMAHTTHTDITLYISLFGTHKTPNQSTV